MKKKQWLQGAAWGSAALLVLKVLLWMFSDWNQMLVSFQWTGVNLLLENGQWLYNLMVVVTAILQLVGMAGFSAGLLLLTWKQKILGRKLASVSLLVSLIPDALAMAPSFALGLRYLTGGGSYELLALIWMVGVAGLSVMRVIWLAACARGFWPGRRFSRLAKMMSGFALAADLALVIFFGRQYLLGAFTWALEAAVIGCLMVCYRKKKQKNDP